MEFNKNQKIIIIVLVAIIIVLISISAFALMQNKTETLEINDINMQQDAFGIYQLVGHVTPKKDFDYLEARIIFSDEQNTVIGKTPIAWNINHAKSGEKLSLGNGMGGVCDGTPSYAIVEFYDAVNGETPIANATITFNGNNTNTTNETDTSTVSQSNTDNSNNGNDKKYSEEDLENAKNDAYSQGFNDGYVDYDDNYYYDDVSSGGSSGSSSSGSGSVDSGSSSSDVETTTN